MPVCAQPRAAEPAYCASAFPEVLSREPPGDVCACFRSSERCVLYLNDVCTRVKCVRNAAGTAAACQPVKGDEQRGCRVFRGHIADQVTTELVQLGVVVSGPMASQG